ncbi:glycoside hydrolase domain-containing protein [Glycomyces arizonensis]|uniref:glycoside hydrolase domain-containing protein n=1 Tax=Glycomyces arizonensis TaxID=256035 RepID=UPI00041E8AFD|nr:glycoside hydrolase domain-containing protein [Glycomyces arizonensis]
MRRESAVPAASAYWRFAIGLALTGLMSVLLVVDASRPATADPPQRDYVDLVNPWIESDLSRFFFFQSASQPFGFVKLRPDTSTHHSRGTGYHWNENEVKGFSHIHDWQLSGVQVMPTTGTDVPKLEGDTGWQSPVDHEEGEIAEPGYHRLELDRYGITAELTATERVGMHRYTYNEAGPSEIIVNLGGQLGEAEMENARVTKVGDHTIEGYVVQHGDRSIHPSTKLFFTIDFDRPFDSLHGWAEGSLVNGGGAVDEVSGEDMGVYVRYDDLDAGEQVQMKVGLSLTGIEGARRNLETELPGWDFDATRQASQQEWNEMLGRIDVQGGSHEQQVKFYTDLFHVLAGRSAISDVDGRYLDATWGDDRIGQIPLDGEGEPEFAMYNYDALWLTQWNLNSVLGMAYPEIYSSLVRSQLQMYEDGGLLPRGPVAGDYSMIMTSSPVTSFIAGAYNKGIRDFDIDLAYEAMLDAQSVGGLFDKGSQDYDSWDGDGIRGYLDLGYVPGNAGETLEYAYQDWTLAQLAGELDATGVNAAQFADVAVSSGLDESDASGERAVDGRPSRAPTPTEWRSDGEEHPWIELSWEQPRNVDTVVLSDRLSEDSNANSGVLTFSDGTQETVTDIPDNGEERTIEFEPRQVEWVKFEATGGSGPDVGLNEFEVWDDTDVHDYLMERSRNWRNVFDHDTGFSRPRGADGNWKEPFDPLSKDGFVQAPSWQSTWFTVHDVMGLANELGGTQAYADKLNYAFEESEDEHFISDYEGGYVSYGNQPGLEMAHLFNYVGKPWLTQYWVRQVNETTYGSIATDDGYGHHDEDQGQMGALSALMSMGLFEVTGGGLSRPVYDITSPVFDEITIELHPDYYDGGRFRILTHGNSDENMYIQRAELDGQSLNNSWFHHDQLTDGGTLELWMGAEPDEDWGVEELPPSESEPAAAVASFDDDAPRVDPGGRTTVALNVANHGDEPITVHWDLSEEPEELKVTPKAGAVRVAPGETATREVRIEAPADAPEGTYRVALDAHTVRGTPLPETVAYVQVAPAVSLTWAPDEFGLLQDTPATIRATMVNNDTDRTNSAEVGLEAPEGWTVEPDHRQIDLSGGETVGVDFTVTPPADASGAEQLTLTVDGDWGGLSHPIETTVSAKVALIGAIDTRSTEFALSPDGYGDYPEQFPDGVDFTVGTDDPATDWSYIQPGPGDSWAQSASSDFTLRFDLDQVPEDGLALTAWLLDTQQALPPSIEVSLNGHPPTTVELPAGGGDGYHWEYGEGAADGIQPSQLDALLPADQLVSGENTVTIANTDGSWLVYDAIGIHGTS